MIEDPRELAGAQTQGISPAPPVAAAQTWWKPLLFTLGVVAASSIASWACMWVIALTGITMPGATPSNQYGIAPHVAMGVLTVLLVLILARPQPISTLGLSQFDRKAVLASSLGSIAAMNGGTYVVWIMQSMSGETSSREQSAELFDALRADEAILYGTVLFTLVAVNEELLFRGYLMRRWLVSWSPVRSIGLSAFVFALAHLSPSHALAVLPVGVWFGYIAWRTNSTLNSIIAHGATLMFWLAFTLALKTGVHEHWLSFANLVVTIVCARVAWRWLKSPHITPTPRPATPHADLGRAPA